MPVSVPPNSISANSAPVEQVVSNRAAVVAMETETPSDELARLRALLRDERMAHAIQKANAEQARRMADCRSHFHDALLSILPQPCLVLDRDGAVSFWNKALADWTGIAPASAVGRVLEALFPSEATEALDAAFRVAAHAAESALSSEPAARVPGIFSSSEALSAATFTLLPLCRVPGRLESCFILIQPFR